MIKETERIVIDKTIVCDFCGLEEERKSWSLINACPVCDMDVCEECSILVEEVEEKDEHSFTKVCSEECAGIYREWQDILQTKYDELDILFESRRRDFEKVATLNNKSCCIKRGE